jgi:hypothetical protein
MKLKQSTKELLWMLGADLFLLIMVIQALSYIAKGNYTMAIIASMIGLINAYSAFNSYKNWKVAKASEEEEAEAREY